MRPPTKKPDGKGHHGIPRAFKAKAPSLRIFLDNDSPLPPPRRLVSIWRIQGPSSQRLARRLPSRYVLWKPQSLSRPLAPPSHTLPPSLTCPLFDTGRSSKPGARPTNFFPFGYLHVLLTYFTTTFLFSRHELTLSETPRWSVSSFIFSLKYFPCVPYRRRFGYLSAATFIPSAGFFHPSSGNCYTGEAICTRLTPTLFLFGYPNDWTDFDGFSFLSLPFPVLRCAGERPTRTRFPARPSQIFFPT